MSTLKVNAIYDTTGGSNTVLYGVAAPTNSMGFRNRIINGAMMIDQRNAGASVSTTGSFVTDRFKFNFAGGGTISGQQATDSLPTGFSQALKFTVGTADTSIAAGDEYIFDTTVEGFNFSDFLYGSASAQACTISFWVRSSVTGTYSVTLKNSANSRAYPATYTVSAANTWEQKTITVAGDTSGTWIGATNGIGLRLRFCLVSGSTYLGTANAWQAGDLDGATGQVNWMATSGNTFYITGVQLEAGSVASPFERRDYGRELMMCQRYYYRRSATSASEFIATIQAYSTGGAYGKLVDLPVVMRATPTVNISSISHFRPYSNVGGGLSAFTSAGSWAGSSPYQISQDGGFNGSSGLTAGNATVLAFNSTSGWFDASSEL